MSLIILNDTCQIRDQRYAGNAPGVDAAVVRVMAAVHHRGRHRAEEFHDWAARWRRCGVRRFPRRRNGGGIGLYLQKLGGVGKHRRRATVLGAASQQGRRWTCDGACWDAESLVHLFRTISKTGLLIPNSSLQVCVEDFVWRNNFFILFL